MEKSTHTSQVPQMPPQMPKIKDQMSPCPYAVSRQAPLTEVIAMMKREEVRHLLVTDGGEQGRLEGVITQHVADLVGSLQGAEDSVAGDIMMSKPFVVRPDASLESVCLDMATHQEDYAIVAEDGEVLGIFTSFDAIRALGELLSERSGLQAA